MIRFKNLTEGALIGFNTAHPDGGTTVGVGPSIVDQRLENHLLALVGLPIGGSGDIGIGQILGDDLYPGPFSIQRGAGTLNARDEFDHGEVSPKVQLRPVMAILSLSMEPVMSWASRVWARLFSFMANISCSKLTELPSRLEATAIGSTERVGTGILAI